jgi:hypothetical protein
MELVVPLDKGCAPWGLRFFFGGGVHRLNSFASFDFFYGDEIAVVVLWVLAPCEPVYCSETSRKSFPLRRHHVRVYRRAPIMKK